MPKVLISDTMSSRAEEIFRERGVEVDVVTELDPAELEKIIVNYDGLAVRSSTKVTEKIIGAGSKLRVIGRAGIGVDNIDVGSASKKGIVVMNTPQGNSITTAEHAIALLFALARDIPQANQSTHEGLWEKSKFMGVELYGKTLGVIGCGNIGSIVADRAIGLKMKVVSYDPFLSPEKATSLGVEKIEFDELLQRSDFISLHTPMTDATKGIIDTKAISKMKDGVYIINCARGGLVNEVDLKTAIDTGKVAGAALDVFSEEPAKDNVLFGYPNVLVTPHLGASTSEAQVNVAIQVAEQMSDYLVKGVVLNALNMPSVSVEDAPKLAPYMKLSEQLGSFLGQVASSAINKVHIEYCGQVAELNTKPLTSLVLKGLLAPVLDSVNTVNAPNLARERGVEVKESLSDKIAEFQTLIRVVTSSEEEVLSIAGTVFHGSSARVVAIKDISIDTELGPNMLYVTNKDKPGIIGSLGGALGDANVNIATFSLGRDKNEGNAIALVETDGKIPNSVVNSVKNLPMVLQVCPLNF